MAIIIVRSMNTKHCQKGIFKHYRMLFSKLSFHTLSECFRFAGRNHF